MYERPFLELLEIINKIIVKDIDM